MLFGVLVVNKGGPFSVARRNPGARACTRQERHQDASHELGRDHGDRWIDKKLLRQLVIPNAMPQPAVSVLALSGEWAQS